MAGLPIEQWDDPSWVIGPGRSGRADLPVLLPVARYPAALCRPSPAWQSWQRGAKRTLDVAAALCGLILLAPVMALIALAIRFDSPGPIIFRQTRCGKDGRHFVFLKFRSMVADAEARKTELLCFNEVDGPIFKMRNDPRLTRVGRIIRSTSLDELPQLWNVLRGEMSIVGPRPPLPAEVAEYEGWQRGRLAATGGVTGLWQVSGRSRLGFDEMVELDIQYIEEWSLWLDIVILAKTVKAVILMRGAY